MNARRSARIFIVGAIIMALVFFLSPGLAGAMRVVLIGPAAGDPIVTRVRDELTVMGIEVEVLPPEKALGDLAELAQRYDAAAALRVEMSPPEIVLWVDPSRASEANAPAELRVSDSLSGDAEPAVLALRAVELLRARLIPVPQNPPPEDEVDAADVQPDVELPQTTPSPPVASSPPRPLPRPALPKVQREAPKRAEPRASHPLDLFFAPAVLFSPGGVDPTPHLRLGAQWNPVPRAGIETLAFIPISAATVSAPEGSIDLRVLNLGAGIRGLLTEPESRWFVNTGIGLGAILLLFEGTASEPQLGQAGSHWVASPYAVLGAGYRLSSRLALRIDALGSLVRPEPVLRIAGQRIASFGQPAVFLACGLEVRP